MASLYTVEEFRSRWGTQAPSETRAEELLAVSEYMCLTYSPVEDVEDVPPGHREAHYQQARDIWNGSKASAGGMTDEGSFALTPFPMTWMVKALLRPDTGIPLVG